MFMTSKDTSGCKISDNNSIETNSVKGYPNNKRPNPEYIMNDSPTDMQIAITDKYEMRIDKQSGE